MLGWGTWSWAECSLWLQAAARCLSSRGPQRPPRGAVSTVMTMPLCGGRAEAQAPTHLPAPCSPLVEVAGLRRRGRSWVASGQMHVFRGRVDGAV